MTSVENTDRPSDDLAELRRTVSWLAAREQIRDVPLAYARGIDARDFDASRAQFADGCQIDGTLNQAPIEEYWPNLVEGVRRFPATMHFMGNQYVDVEPGATTGFVETYAVATHIEDPDRPERDLVMGVRYCDDVERRGDRWLIVRRRVFAQWVRGPLPGT